MASSRTLIRLEPRHDEEDIERELRPGDYVLIHSHRPIV